MRDQLLRPLRLCPWCELDHLQYILGNPGIMHQLAKLVVKRGDLLVGFPDDGVTAGEGVAKGSDAEGYAEVEWTGERGAWE